MKYILSKSTDILKFAILVDYTQTDDEVVISTDEKPTFFINKWNGEKWVENATLEQIADFNKPKVPDSVKSIAFMSALELIGITNTMVLQFIETLTPPMNIFVKHSFERATFFERQSPFIPMVGQAFNKTDAELDNVFITAREIEKQLNL